MSLINKEVADFNVQVFQNKVSGAYSSSTLRILRSYVLQSLKIFKITMQSLRQRVVKFTQYLPIHISHIRHGMIIQKEYPRSNIL